MDFTGAPLTFYGQQWGAAAVSDNGYIVFGDSFYPYEPTTFGDTASGAPKVSAPSSPASPCVLCLSAFSQWLDAPGPPAVTLLVVEAALTAFIAAPSPF